MTDRQICPSKSKINFDRKRTPTILVEKKCCYDECLIGEGHKCEEYQYPIEVIYHDVDDEGETIERYETIHMSVACVCVVPRFLPEPPIE